MKTLIYALLVSLVLISCNNSSDSTPAAPPAPPPPANTSNGSSNESDTIGVNNSGLATAWGGPGVSLMMGASKAALQFNCAAGTIDQQFMPNQNGDFELKGTVTQDHPGVHAANEVLPVYQAVYLGHVEVDATNAINATMDLEIYYLDNQSKQKHLSYTLTAGAVAAMTACH